MISKKIVLIIFIFIQQILAQNLEINRIDPPNWWVGMKWNKLQIMLYGENLNQISAKFDNDKILVNNIKSSENGKYAFVDIIVPGNLAFGEYTLSVEGKKGKT